MKRKIKHLGQKSTNFKKTNHCITLSLDSNTKKFSFYAKIHQNELLHNSQDEVSQKDFSIQTNFSIQTHPKKISPSDKGKKSLGEGVAEKKHRNQACLVCFFEARGRLSPTKKNELLHNYTLLNAT
jgi:hypothetical protein